MLKNILILPDGTEISSGAGEDNAIGSVTLTECVNSGSELTLGSVCAAMLEATLIALAGGLSLNAGTEVTLYKEDDGGTRTQLGLFTLEKPTRSGPNTLKLTAYDRVSLLDKDLTGWLAGLDGWPYSLYEFAELVCQECGLILANSAIPNGDYEIQKFAADGITGRQLMTWVGEAAGRFCRATPEGLLELAWYTPSGVSIGPEGDRFFYRGSLSYEDYQVAAIDKVQIKLTENDVGVIWPSDTGATNAYVISGNYLLTTGSMEALLPVAQTIYQGLQGVQYTPCKVSIPANLDIRAGNTVAITDANGKTITAYVMTKSQAGQRDTLECTGSPRRDSTTAVNAASYKALSGKVLEIKTAMEGVSVTAKELKTQADSNTERIASLELTAEELKTTVSETKTEVQSYADTQAQAAEDAAKGYTDETLQSYSTTTEVQSMIDQKADEISLLVSETVTTEVDEAVSGLKIGGRNLLPNTKRMEGYSFNANMSLQEDAEEGFRRAVWESISSTGTDRHLSTSKIPFSKVLGQEVTFSFWVRSDDYESINASGSKGVGIKFYLYTDTGTSSVFTGSINRFDFALSADWQRISDTVILSEDFFKKVGSSSTTIDDCTMLCAAVNSNSQYSMQVKKLQLEFGNMPTDWSPSPEDQEAAAAKAQSTADEAKDAADSLAGTVEREIARLDIRADGIASEVSKQTTRVDQMEESLSTLRQTADSFSVEFQTIKENGVERVTTQTGYTFNEEGLTISKSGQEMENKLDNTGMYVTRSGEAVLQANNQGVAAADVQVRNYLIVGSHARFEDYGTDRTACFYV